VNQINPSFDDLVKNKNSLERPQPHMDNFGKNRKKFTEQIEKLVAQIDFIIAVNT
jgi:hypothetical protein